MTSYIIALTVSLGILILLKFCEGWPMRSWTGTLATGVLLGAIAGYYFNHAMPAKAVPSPQAQKASVYQAELERTFRRIAGVDSASIEGSSVRLNFTEDQSLEQLKQIAVQVGGSTAYFLKTGKTGPRITVYITVRGRDRYEMTYEANRGITDEKNY